MHYLAHFLGVVHHTQHLFVDVRSDSAATPQRNATRHTTNECAKFPPSQASGEHRHYTKRPISSARQTKPTHRSSPYNRKECALVNERCAAIGGGTVTLKPEELGPGVTVGCLRRLEELVTTVASTPSSSSSLPLSAALWSLGDRLRRERDIDCERVTRRVGPGASS